MTKTEDLLNNPRPHHIRNDRVDLNKVIVMVQETMNPFDVNLHLDKLYNTGTGLAAMDSTQFFTEYIEKCGKERKIFIQECSQDSRAFEKHIKRQKITSFATETGKQKITASDRKILSACLMCDFGAFYAYCIGRLI